MLSPAEMPQNHGRLVYCRAFFFAMVGVMLLTVLFLCSCFDSFADEFGGVHVWKQVNHSCAESLRRIAADCPV